jgi:hypothetical protein
MFIITEILIDLLMEAGAIAVLALVTAGAGWLLFRKPAGYLSKGRRW